jgi:hypothetical protein
MDTPTVYVIVGGSLFGILLTMRLLQYLRRFRTIFGLAARGLTYPYLVDRHHLVGPWTRAEVLLSLAYTAVNLFCVLYPNLSTSSVHRRSGLLSSINMMFLYSSPSLTFLADCLGTTGWTCRVLHRAAAWMGAGLLTIHITCAMSLDPRFPLRTAGNMGAVIVCQVPSTISPYN